MSKRQPALWDADPHTVAKIDILKGYLNAWFLVLGKSKPGQVISYIDGFAGPGQYRNHREGSPVAALRAATSAIQHLGPDFVAKELQCIFIESNQQRFDMLVESVAPYEATAKIQVAKIHSEFAEGIEEVSRRAPATFRKGATFVFADPFGGKGIPLSTFRRCMGGEAGELLINLDADGIGRMFAAQRNPRRDEQLTSIFGGEVWRGRLTLGAELKKVSVEILDLYKERLRTLPGVRFVWSFAMRGKHDALNYYLVFATKHPLGMEKMKESMRAIDKTGAYTFSDAHRDQQVLFRDDNIEHYASALFEVFKARTISMEDARFFALSETPFVNAKSMLEFLESQGRLQVTAREGQARRKGSFPEDKVASLRFVENRAKNSQPELGL